MVLSETFLKNNAEFVASNHTDYTLLNTGHFEWGADIKTFNEGIQVWNLINCMRIINRFLDKSKLAETINYSILFDVLEAIETDTALSDEKLVEYLEFERTMEKMTAGLTEVAPAITEVMFINTAAFLMIIGFNKEKQLKLSYKKDVEGLAYDKLHEIKNEAFNGNFPLSEFRAKALKFMEGELKKVR